jgi:hypothetical protein
VSRLRRHLPLAGAVVCAGLAALLVLFAGDVAAWRSAIARDDMRFRALPTHRELWRARTTLPGDPASTLLGTSSTIAWRRAMQYFWYSHIGRDPTGALDPDALRARAQQSLLDELSAAPTVTQRSTAANLLGVLVVTTPAPGNDRNAVEQILKRAMTYFQQSIELDPTNLDAKENLELVLRITRPGKGSLGKDTRSGYGSFRGQSAGNLGSGY